MDRAERLLDLVTFLVNADRPVPFKAIRAHFEDYARVSVDSALRKFERDKADLLDLGIPLAYHEPDPDADTLEEVGYRIPPEAYFLPKLELSPEELALLTVAGAAVRGMEGFPWQSEVGRALEKIAFAAEESGARPAELVRRLAVDPGAGGDPKRVGAHFAALRDALMRRKTVELDYHGFFRDEVTRRAVDPYGLFLRGGIWCLFGHCHLREGPRTFHLDRIARVTVNPARPRSPDYEIPGSVDLAALARQRPFEYPIEDEQAVRVRLEPRLAFSARALFGEHAAVEEQGDGGAEVTVRVRHLDALVDQVISLGDGARILSPEAARTRIVERVTAALAGAESGAAAPGGGEDGA